MTTRCSLLGSLALRTLLLSASARSRNETAVCWWYSGRSSQLTATGLCYTYSAQSVAAACIWPGSTATGVCWSVLDFWVLPVLDFDLWRCYSSHLGHSSLLLTCADILYRATDRFVRYLLYSSTPKNRNKTI